MARVLLHVVKLFNHGGVERLLGVERHDNSSKPENNLRDTSDVSQEGKDVIGLSLEERFSVVQSDVDRS